MEEHTKCHGVSRQVTMSKPVRWSTALTTNCLASRSLLQFNSGAVQQLFNSQVQILHSLPVELCTWQALSPIVLQSCSPSELYCPSDQCVTELRSAESQNCCNTLGTRSTDRSQSQFEQSPLHMSHASLHLEAIVCQHLHE